MGQVRLLAQKYKHRLHVPPQEGYGEADSPANQPGSLQHLTQHCVIARTKRLDMKQSNNNGSSSGGSSSVGVAGSLVGCGMTGGGA